ncbi:MAG: 2Fe-2S iron-sulfur cluster-binding protein [Candidatus Bathyarchaeia archaeon]
MSQRTVKVKVFRFNPSVDEKPHYQIYEVPLTRGMSVLDMLDYIYENLDGSLAYYDHAACRQAMCGGCTLIINGKPSLACQTFVEGDMTVEPLKKFNVVRDLVYKKGGQKS